MLAALVYAGLFYPRLPGPRWWRGLLFCQAMWLGQGLVVLPWLGKGWFAMHISATAPLWSWALNALYGVVLGGIYSPSDTLDGRRGAES